jgi:hypothetical protein
MPLAPSLGASARLRLRDLPQRQARLVSDAVQGSVLSCRCERRSESLEETAAQPLDEREDHTIPMPVRLVASRRAAALAGQPTTTMILEYRDIAARKVSKYIMLMETQTTTTVEISWSVKITRVSRIPSRADTCIAGKRKCPQSPMPSMQTMGLLNEAHGNLETW